MFFIGGTVLSGLFNPLFWVLYLVWLVLAIAGFDQLFPQIAAAHQPLQSARRQRRAHVSSRMIAPLRRGWLSLIPFSLTTFFYWVLISIAAYKALWQLVRNPFYWEKTQHGVSRHPAAGAETVPAEGVVP